MFSCESDALMVEYTLTQNRLSMVLAFIVVLVTALTIALCVS